MVGLDNVLSHHIEYIEMDSRSLFQCKIIRVMVRGAEFKFTKNRGTVMPVFLEDMIVNPIFFAPTLELLVGDLQETRDCVRWTLSLIQLKFAVNKECFQEDELMASALRLHLPNATALEQYDWIKIYLMNRELFHFLRGTVHAIVRGNAIIQKRLLDEFKFPGAANLRFLKEAISFEVRLIHVRENFRTERSSSIFRTFMSGLSSSGDIKKTAIQFLTIAVENDIFITQKDGYYQVPLMGDRQLASIAYMITILLIFGLSLPVKIHPAQIRILLGYEPFSTATLQEHFPSTKYLCQTSWLDHVMKTIVEEARQLACATFLPIFDFDTEILPRLLPS